MTLEEIQQLDAAYWFRPGSYSHSAPPEEYLMRGIRTGDTPAPPGYAPRDFRIPTLEEVLDAFPTTPINIEIKMIKTPDGEADGCVTEAAVEYCDDPLASVPAAEALAAVLSSPDYAWRQDIIVVSFSDLLVHVWTTGDADEQPASYKRLIDLGVDGIMSSVPGRLHAYLCAAEVPRPNGADRCPNAAVPGPAVKPPKKCKKGKKRVKRKGKFKCVKKKKNKKKGKRKKRGR